ncbi:MAG: hypothetical protein ACKV19_21385 [Verrucomicrobiales bacterium]
MTPSAETTDPSAPSEWLLFACSQCAHPLKVRVDQARALFRCPSCQCEQSAPTDPARSASQADGGAPPGFEGGSTLAVDRLGSAPFRNVSDPALAIPDEGIRVRKRKRRPHQGRPRSSTPEWEAEAGAPTGTTSGPANQDWEEVTSATVKQEVREDGSVVERRKRMVRKRLPPVVQKVWSVMTRVGSLSLVLLGLFVLVGAAVAGWYLARSQAPVVAQAVEVEEFPERYYPTQDEGTAAAELVKEFLLANTVEQKLPLVRFPQKVKPLMELWYKGREDRSLQATRDEGAESLTKFLHIDGTKFIVVTMLLEPQHEYKLFAVESTPDHGLKVDWETAVGWQAMTVEEFMKGKPTTPQPFRVQAEPGDYYNGHYADESVWCAVTLSYPGNPDFGLYGYVDRTTPTGERLMQLMGYRETRDEEGKKKWELVQGTRMPLILALAYRREGSDPKQVTIHEILHEQWFLRDGPAIGHGRRSAASQ